MTPAYEADNAICPDGYGTKSLDDYFEARAANIIHDTAARYDLSPTVLWSAIDHAQHDEFFRMLDAQRVN
jgi:hypothetical protein